MNQNTRSIEIFSFQSTQSPEAFGDGQAGQDRYSTLSTSLEAVQDADDDVDNAVDADVADDHVFRGLCEHQDA